MTQEEEDTFRTVQSYFPKKQSLAKINTLLSLLKEESRNQLSERQKKEFARAIVASSERLLLPDDLLFSGEKPIEFLFLHCIAQTRTGFQTYLKENGRYGILGLPDRQIAEIETKFNAKIDRKFDVYQYSIQYRVFLILFKDYLSKGLSAEKAYNQLFALPENSTEWKNLESTYIKYHEKIIPKNL